MECVITQKFHRSIMGPKGSRIQQITKDHSVQIKFPDREDPNGEAAPLSTCPQSAERSCTDSQFSYVLIMCLLLT